MKKRRLLLFVLTAAITAAMLASCATSPDNSETTNYPDDLIEDGDGIVEFRPVDCGLMAQELYEYSFLGMNVELSDVMLDKMSDKEVFVFTLEDYTADYDISYGVMRFSATTEDDRNADTVLSVDIQEFESGLEKIGAIGVYEKSVVSQLDSLTACDIHERIGTSADGAYEYYISINSNGDQKLASELKKSVITLGQMHEFDPSLGYNAFSTDRIDDVNTVGTFSTEDVFGNIYTQDMFADYDLTLVNVFATWCSPCVEEIPELEKLRQEYEQKGIKFGVVAVVLDVKTALGTDEGALEKARTLYERSEAKFPFLIPDEGNMNGRLTGIESIPESFFVDQKGNIVSEPYVGARSQKAWAEIVNSEFEKLQGEN